MAASRKKSRAEVHRIQSRNEELAIREKEALARANKKRKSILDLLPPGVAMPGLVKPAPSTRVAPEDSVPDIVGIPSAESEEKGEPQTIGGMSKDTQRWMRYELEGENEMSSLEKARKDDAERERLLMRRARLASQRTCSKRFWYFIDSKISNRANQMKAFIIIFALFILLGALLWFFCIMEDDMPTDSSAILEAIWWSWSYMADPGTHADSGDSDDTVSISIDALAAKVDVVLNSLAAGASSGAGATAAAAALNATVAAAAAAAEPVNGSSVVITKRIVSFIIAAMGIVMFTILLAIFCDIVAVYLDGLKKGKSAVVEDNHTLILGWTDKTVALIKEICLANESDKGGCIVVLADMDKELLELEFNDHVKRSELKGTKVVFRTGNAMMTSDLMKVAASTARSIVVLANDGPPDEADCTCLRTVLSLMSLTSGLKGHIVAEIRDVDNEILVQMVGLESVETVVSHDLVGRLMLMSARQPGLARVYNSILGFDGDEFYMKQWPEITGARFGDLQLRFPDATPIGIHKVDGSILLNPPLSTIMHETDELIVIAEDDDTYQAEDPITIYPGDVPNRQQSDVDAENILVCGWRRDIRDVITLLDDMAAPDSKVHMLNNVPVFERNQRLEAEGLDLSTLHNIELVHHRGDPASRRHLLNLPVEKYTSALIFADQEREDDPMSADSRSIAALLLLRNIQRQRKDWRKRQILKQHGMEDKVMSWNSPNEDSCPTTCEILDARTQRTIANNPKINDSSDFLETNTMVSRILAMVAEDRGVIRILSEMLAKEGASVMVKPSHIYANKDELINYYAICRRAQVFGEIVIGYMVHGRMTEAHINPRLKHEDKSWGNYDIIVLAGTSTAKSKEKLDAAATKSMLLEKHAASRETAGGAIKRKTTMLTPEQRAAKASEAFKEELSTMETVEVERFVSLLAHIKQMALS